jgi:hypothetical protein
MGDDDKRGRANNVYCPDVNLTWSHRVLWDSVRIRGFPSVGILVQDDSTHPNRIDSELNVWKVRGIDSNPDKDFFICFGLWYIYLYLNRLHIYLECFCVLNISVLKCPRAYLSRAHRSTIQQI